MSENNLEYTFENGNHYDGEWKNDLPHGQGTYTWADGRKYVGEFKNGKRHGHGTITYIHEAKYVGEWKDGKKNGQGTYTHANKNVYVGEFKDDKQHGHGSTTFPSGKNYVGQFKNGKWNGKGTLTSANGSVYVGTYKNGKRQGHFDVTFTTGDKYVGEFKDNNRNGHFVVTYADGDEFVGEYLDSKRHGPGKFTLSNGTVVREGIWENGEFKMGQMKDLVMEKYIGYYEEIIPHVLCRDIINYNFSFQQSTYSSHKGRTETSNERVRMDEIWIKSGNVYYDGIKAAFEYTIKKYSEEHPLFSVQHITDFRLNRYLKDGFMSSHVDNIHHSHGQQYGYPQVSVLLFLNDDYEGGEFIVADKVYRPQKGSALIFPSNFMFPHEVKTVTKGTRWSILAWLM